jgi:hypothetical protein
VDYLHEEIESQWEMVWHLVRKVMDSYMLRSTDSSEVYFYKILARMIPCALLWDFLINK